MIDTVNEKVCGVFTSLAVIGACEALIGGLIVWLW